MGVFGIILAIVVLGSLSLGSAPQSPPQTPLAQSRKVSSATPVVTKPITTKPSTTVKVAPSKTVDTVGKVPNASEPTYVASFPPLTLTALYLNTRTEPTVTVSPIPQTFTAIPDVMVRVKASKLNIRASALSNADILGQIPFDETVKAIGISSDGAWALVTYQNIRGWISISPDLVNISGNRNSLAVIVPTANPNAVSNTGNGTPRATARPRATTAVSTAICECNKGDTLNCKNFKSQRDAQACFEYCKAQTGRDVHDLDGGKKNGIACESLP